MRAHDMKRETKLENQKRFAPRLTGIAMMTLAAAAAWPATASAAPGTWTALPSDPITNSPHRNAVLLTDGRVLAQAEFDGHLWSVLTPDASGSYVWAVPMTESNANGIAADAAGNAVVTGVGPGFILEKLGH